jgi:nucleoside phosphorylase
VSEPDRPLRHDERPEEAVAAIAYFIAQEEDPYKRNLMMRDYAARSRGLDAGVRMKFHDRVVKAFLPYEHPTVVEPSLPAPAVDIKDVDVLVLAVQRIEWAAVIDALGISPTPTVEYKQQPYYHTTIPCNAAGMAGAPTELSVVVTLVGEGLNLHTMRMVSEISQHYRARAWVLVGMAAGLPGEVSRGDVIFPKTVWWYEPGRLLPDLFEPRPEFAIRPLNRQLMRFDPSSESLANRLRAAVDDLLARHRPDDLPADFAPNKISVMNQAVATGELLLRDGELLSRLHAVNQRIVLADQESYGFATACRGVNWMIARGIADYGDPRKDDSWQYLATLLAMHCVLEFFERDYIPTGIDADF